MGMNWKGIISYYLWGTEEKDFFKVRKNRREFELSKSSIYFEKIFKK